MQLGVDESYTLNVTSPIAVLVAPTVYGALRGLETFSQLLECQENEGQWSYTIGNTPITLSDKPRFPWRGLLIDTSRHFLPLDTIYTAIDGLAYSKMNTLHWHAVDAQSFPFESDTVPQLVQGAWRNDLVYSKADMAAVVAYGKARGVRVVVEFDTPGHAASWGKGVPEMTVTDCPAYTHNINNIPLNPTINLTYSILAKFFGEMAATFSDHYLHFGGDEVVYGCWGQDQNIVNFKNRHGFSFDQLLNYYFQNVWQGLPSWQKNPVVWQEVFLAGVSLPAQAVVHIWEAPSAGVTVLDVIKKNHKTIVSPGWYLDHLDQTWADMYVIDPTTNCTSAAAASAGRCFNITDPTEAALVLGGEAAMWGEQVDGNNFSPRVWPRTAAVAERLWSRASVNDPNAALSRLLAHRCRLVRRGVAAAPLQPGFC